MVDCMMFPDTVEEYMEQYKIVDTEQVYTNGAELVPIFRMKQWFEHLPSAQPIECRKQGEWDMFELITTAWYGKQYYFKEENGMAYSRKSHKTMTVHDAILEFIREIGG